MASRRRPEPAATPLGALALMQAMQLGHAVAALHAAGVMDALHRPRKASALAAELGLDAIVLEALLDHAARATRLVARQGRCYRSTADWDDAARFLVGLYGLAFGPAAATARRVLAGGRARIDFRMHAKAFDKAPGGTASLLAGLLSQLGLRQVVDVGCGPATLLHACATADPAFRGWGVEAHAAMRAKARAVLREAGCAKQVQLLAADGRDVAAWLQPTLAVQVQAVVASQFVNEMFGGGGAQVVTWLTELHRRLPGRVLIVADYLGRLGSGLAAPDRLTLVHDHAQLLSGQGVPPPRRRDWARLYREAGCRLVHALEDSASTRFVHVVRL